MALRDLGAELHLEPVARGEAFRVLALEALVVEPGRARVEGRERALRLLRRACVDLPHGLLHRGAVHGPQAARWPRAIDSGNRASSSRASAVGDAPGLCAAGGGPPQPSAAAASEAYLIEGGRITKPVVGATLIGNGPDILTKVTRIGHDLKLDEGVGTCSKGGQNVPVGVGLPTILVSEMTVGGTRQ